ncbi:MAG: NYN domain-containing protein [Arcobacteraceae bacterium]|jgi:uncharacterized LabA/DUF88 family protein|nr:NYN domain-containing protein [Arcobacteraceae bacterium]MDY0364261.1 NYN domain-containing protein [Arcobacteraceae bacterium]
MKNHEAKLAVLIDADNTSHNIIAPLLEEISKYGIANVKRIYGDWTDTQLSGWKHVLLERSIVPIQQFSYTTGKNSTDIAMIIDAMDLLYSGNFDGFCLISSDSDFTRLASRIRESGLKVYGFGRQTTPISFMSACDKFVFIETILKHSIHERASDIIENMHYDEENSCITISKEDLQDLFRKIILDLSDESGWARLDSVGTRIYKIVPHFDVRCYNYSKLSKLLQSLEIFEFKKLKTKHSKTKDLFVRVSNQP